MAETAGVRNAYTLPFMPWLATILRQQASALRDQTPVRREALLERAEEVARRAVRACRLCRNDLPHALRELGLIQAMRGSVRRTPANVGQEPGDRREARGALRVCASRSWPGPKWPRNWASPRRPRIRRVPKCYWAS